MKKIISVIAVTAIFLVFTGCFTCFRLTQSGEELVAPNFQMTGEIE